MLIALLMGFSSGIPLLLTLRTLQAWMTEAGVDLKTVGIFAFQKADLCLLATPQGVQTLRY
jgi:hypothetical protein